MAYKWAQREMKFRVWDTVEKKWVEEDITGYGWMVDYDPPDSFGAYLKDPRYIVVQSTGLKDKNGVEVYGGDIMAQGDWRGVVKMAEYPDGEMGYWHCFHYGWVVRGAKGEQPATLNDVNEGAEVIGNIFENPELLERGGE